MTKFQSTPPARGATKGAKERTIYVNISIHTPREGGDAHTFLLSVSMVVFQSTPPARGATLSLVLYGVFPIDFNPHPPRGGRHG